ncbi:hypothetical protein R3W88_017154 [Solanum pinnatisectum]|uniref:Uncharacterized protein n=1 Tax=Solanum pinnatisectum TaxID=50273 RepID=A0AAV9KZP8_9SOLN|nr:hypothetical protein R3W88_017154 [Solanum pinnatisectum]
MIANSIKAQYLHPPQSSLEYSKPYSKRIEGLLMPIGYQPPKLQQFDGRGNPRQHITHFVETCSKVLRPVVSPKIEEGVIILQFGSFEPVEVSALKKTTNTSKLACEFKCITDEQRRRVKQDILADFKGTIVKTRKANFENIYVLIWNAFGRDFYICCTSMSYASNGTKIASLRGSYADLLIFSQSCSKLKS